MRAISKQEAAELQAMERNLDVRSDYWDGSSLAVFLDTIKQRFPSSSKVYVLNCVPEQAEDLYWALISRDIVVHMEIRRTASLDDKCGMVFEIIPSKAHAKTLRGRSRNRFDLAWHGMMTAEESREALGSQHR